MSNTINAWVNKDIFNNPKPECFYDIYPVDKNNPHLVKVKLTREAEEIKREITPGQVRYILKELSYDKEYIEEIVNGIFKGTNNV